MTNPLHTALHTVRTTTPNTDNTTITNIMLGIIYQSLENEVGTDKAAELIDRAAHLTIDIINDTEHP